MKILVAAGHVPSPSVRHAAAKTSYHLCRYLAERHELHLLAFATREGLVGFCEQDMVIFRSWRTIPVKNSDRVLGALTAPRLPLAIAARNSHTYRQELHSLLAGQSFDVVLLDHTAMFQYSPETPKSIITVGNAHDIVTQNWSRRVTMASNRLAGTLLRVEASRMRSWEQNAFATLDVVLVPSEKDKKFLLEMQPKATVLVIDPWISTGPDTNRFDPEPGALLYWGAMNRAENIDAAMWAATEILPRIRKAVPHAKLYIAGNYGEVLAREFAERTDVRITGFVDDVQSLMTRMSVALLPLRQGAGIKVKILECMSAGLPVVTTPVGEEGVGGTDGLHYLVAESAEALAAHAVRLLLHPGDARKMGESAKQFLLTRQDFSGKLAAVERFVEERIAYTMSHSEQITARSSLR